MKKSVAVWNYPGKGIDNAREFLKRGFTALSWLGKTFAAMTEEEDEELAALLRESGVPFTVHDRLPDPDSEEACEEYRRNVLRCARWQARYGLMTGLTFDFWFDPAKSMPHLQFALETLRGSGTFLACEDTPLNDRTVNAFQKLLKPEDRYGILLDFGHMNIRQHRMEIAEPEDYVAAIKALPLNVLEVHLHDNKGQKDDHMYMGYGNLPLAACVEGLKKKRFDGLVTVEVVQRDWSPEEGFEHAVATRDAFFKLW